ncbi:Conserved domain protein [uncultured Candidatus Thioglobus sp.]|nr:Conserved domain protein [uncultured Candidatus Thioglobus sp.]
MSKVKLDKYEQEIEDNINVDFLNPIMSKKRQAFIQQTAKNTFKKDKRINIRLTSNDLNNIQIKAAMEGLPYQTLITSIIHKYANGELR